MVTIKTIRKSEDELRHFDVYFDVYFDDEYMGYIIKDDSKIHILEWIFVSKNKKISYFREKNKKNIELKLEKIYKKIPVDINLHFGMNELNYKMK